MKRVVVLLALALTLGARGALCQHSVEITWTASLDAALNPSLTYNVYRASTCPGSFTRLNATPVTGTAYVDTAVATGAAYCYQVTAVLAGIESVPSNQALAAFPPASDRPETLSSSGPDYWLDTLHHGASEENFAFPCGTVDCDCKGANESSACDLWISLWKMGRANYRYDIRGSRGHAPRTCSL